MEKELNAYKNLKLHLLFEGAAVGLLAGLVSVLYRFVLTNSESICDTLIKFAKENVINFFIWIIVLVIIFFIIVYCLKQAKYISGSGIPQVEAEVQGHIDQPWLKTLVLKFVGGSLAIVSGLSLGREGPSIQLGALVAKGFSKLFKRVKNEERYLITCGGAAGLAAAFNAPLAGIMFALEEIHKNFSATSIISVMCASLTGDFISANVFGLQPIFSFDIVSTLPLNYYHWIIILGIVTGLLGAFYNLFTDFMQNLFAKIKNKNEYKIFIPMVLMILFAFFFPYVLGGGHKIVALIETKPLINVLIIALLLKFLFSIVSFASGAPGGIFFPLLILGCLIGNIFGLFIIDNLGVNSAYLNNFIILAMAGYFAAIVRAPLTGIVLIAEMCGTLTQLLPLSIAAFVAYIVANLLKSEPIYENLLHRLLSKETINIQPRMETKNVATYVIEIGSKVEGKLVKDIVWPKDCLLIEIRRGDFELIPSGNTSLLVGDQVVILLANDNYNLSSYFQRKSD